MQSESTQSAMILQDYVNRFHQSNFQWDYRESSITID